MTSRAPAIGNSGRANNLHRIPNIVLALRGVFLSALVIASSVSTGAAATTSIVGPATNLAARLADPDIDEVVQALYRMDVPPPLKTVEIDKAAHEMPAESPYYYYVGTDAQGDAVVWKSPAAIKVAVSDAIAGHEAGDEFASAYIAASVMQGRVGARWRTVFAGAPGPRIYARAFVIAWEQKVARTGVTSRANIAWVHATIQPGTPRTDVYDSLRKRDLVAWYASGGLPGSGCEISASNPNRAWPKADANFPPACAHPAVTVAYTISANFACGTEIDEAFYFDNQDRLTTIVDSKERTTCL